MNNNTTATGNVTALTSWSTTARSPGARRAHEAASRTTRARTRRRAGFLRRLVPGRRSATVAGALLTAIVVACNGSAPVSTAPTDYAHPERPVSPAWVEAHLNDPLVTVIDLRSQALYDAGHVPGARHVAVDQLQATDSAGVPSQLVPPRPSPRSSGTPGSHRIAR